MTISEASTSNFIQRLVMKKWLWLLFCGFFFAYPIFRAYNRELPPELPILSQVEDFSFVSDQKEVIGSTELKGRTYIASFFCLECEGSNEQFKKIQKIQKRVKNLVNSIALVSFTISPEKDSVSSLYAKGRELRNNPYIWKLLTSSKSESETKNFLADNFNLNFESDYFKKFALVDESGRVRAYYTDSKNDINKMMIDVGLLVNRKRLNFKKEQVKEGV